MKNNEENYSEYAEDESEEEVQYTIAPRGIAAIAAMDAGLVDKMDDRRLDAFWTIFTLMMEKYGYIQNEDDEEDYE